MEFSNSKAQEKKQQKKEESQEYHEKNKAKRVEETSEMNKLESIKTCCEEANSECQANKNEKLKRERNHQYTEIKKQQKRERSHQCEEVNEAKREEKRCKTNNSELEANKKLLLKRERDRR